MQTIRIIAIGKIKDAWLKHGIDEYVKRIQPMAKLQIIECEEEKAPENLSKKEEAMVKERECERLLQRIGKSEYSIALNLEGMSYTSPQLADTLQRLGVDGYSTVNFLIGGSLGLSDKLLEQVQSHWCLSALTFPHQLCRLILCEQLYRAYSIQKNLPYHK
jgi:23S rRNA (pseudouridine1915-N3)-methyltransferase